MGFFCVYGILCGCCVAVSRWLYVVVVWLLCGCWGILGGFYGLLSG